MINEEQKLNSSEVKESGAEKPETDKSSATKKEKRLEEIEKELATITSGEYIGYNDLAKYKKDFEIRIERMKEAAIPITQETKDVIYDETVVKKYNYALEENKKFDLLKIEKIVLENIGQNDSRLMKRLFPQNPENISGKVFLETLRKLCLSKNIQIPINERITIMRKAMEYFSEEEKFVYPVAHATGSDSLRLIIGDGAIKEGGTGEHGEAAGQSRGGKQRGVSVAEMDNKMADYTEMFYAKMAANREITKDVLKIDADIIDGKNPIEDFMEICTDFIEVDKFLDAIAMRNGETVEDIKSEIAKEAGKKSEDVSRYDIKKSKMVEQILFGSIEKMSERKHYITAERAKRDYEAFEHIIKMCEECENGDFPKIEFKGKVYRDPNEIIELKHDIYEIDDNDPSENKILVEMQNEYAYFLRPYCIDRKSDKWVDPRYSIDEFKSKSGEILREYAKWIKEGETFKTLLALHPMENDSEDVKNKKIERLRELDNQYPTILIIEGDAYRKNGLTHTIKEGDKPVPFFEVEERILSDVSLGDVKEIVVPMEKMDEIKNWLEASGIEKEKAPRLVAFEYFEIKRLLNHQLKSEATN